MGVCRRGDGPAPKVARSSGDLPCGAKRVLDGIPLRGTSGQGDSGQPDLIGFLLRADQGGGAPGRAGWQARNQITYPGSSQIQGGSFQPKGPSTRKCMGGPRRIRTRLEAGQAENLCHDNVFLITESLYFLNHHDSFK